MWSCLREGEREMKKEVREREREIRADSFLNRA